MFGNKKEKEEDLKAKVGRWWIDLPYLKKLEILLERGTRSGQYPEYDITAIENIGVRVFWNYNNLEKKVLIMETYEKEHKREGR
ncbi:hypothetical protein ES695_07825 [Candidatus Atribacteria bacterium 1244-E10-H5-B2]|nr:MAG: hypothetical protein ES695_07825 [Candidatus Atribacteria bacterium 1244-E10-H5-B2]